MRFESIKRRARASVVRTAAVLAELNAKLHVMNKAAILEFADQIAQDYMEHFSKMVVDYTILKGLDLQMLAEGPSGIGIMSTTLTAPTCNLPSMPFRHFGDLVEREVNPEHARWLAGKWADLARLWAEDPTAPAERITDWKNLYLPET